MTIHHGLNVGHVHVHLFARCGLVKFIALSAFALLTQLAHVIFIRLFQLLHQTFNLLGGGPIFHRLA